jgi:hypothetical protein
MDAGSLDEWAMLWLSAFRADGRTSGALSQTWTCKISRRGPRESNGMSLDPHLTTTPRIEVSDHRPFPRLLSRFAATQASWGRPPDTSAGPPASSCHIVQLLGMPSRARTPFIGYQFRSRYKLHSCPPTWPHHHGWLPSPGLSCGST